MNEFVIVGDVGGHFRVLERILETLEVNIDGQLPEGVSVIQVGDLVRADARFRAQNTMIVQRMQHVLSANPASWIQFIGNHECAVLGGPWKKDWDLDGAFDNECVQVLQDLWTSGRMVLSTVVGTGDAESLVTHAGLTRGFWTSIGQPRDARTASSKLNSLVGKPLSVISSPGSLVLGQEHDAADTQWAEINFELLLPWIESDDLPFNQIHGHSSPFHWPSGDWWPSTPDVIRKHTIVRSDLRRSNTTIPGSGRTLMSVDWTLEAQEPSSLWPLLKVGTAADEPEFTSNAS